jgi:hypothetical protein
MSENHKDTILLLEKKLTEAENEGHLCHKKISNFIRDMESAEMRRDEIAGVIKSLELSIKDLKALDKPVAKKVKPKKEA